MRWFVRLLALVLLGALAILVLGPMAPDGTFFNDLGEAFARALRIRISPFT